MRSDAKARLVPGFGGRGARTWDAARIALARDGALAVLHVRPAARRHDRRHLRHHAVAHLVLELPANRRRLRRGRVERHGHGGRGGRGEEEGAHHGPCGVRRRGVSGANTKGARKEGHGSALQVPEHRGEVSSFDETSFPPLVCSGAGDGVAVGVRTWPVMRVSGGVQSKGCALVTAQAAFCARS